MASRRQDGNVNKITSLHAPKRETSSRCETRSLTTREEVALPRSPYATTREAAEYLRTTVGAINNKVYRGQLRRYKLGRKNLFKRSELDRLIEASSYGGSYGY